jgi:hypothetical protein
MDIDLEKFFDENLHKLHKLGMMWLVASIFASLFLRPTAAFWVVVVLDIATLAGLGSIVLTLVLGGEGFDHLVAGLMLALTGGLVMYFFFGLDLRHPYGNGSGGIDCFPRIHPRSASGLARCGSKPETDPRCIPWSPERFEAQCGHVAIFLMMVYDLCVVAIGIAIVAIPMLPVISKLKK